MEAVEEELQTTAETLGRPEKYSIKFNAIAKQLCELGATDSELAIALDVSISTISLWKVKYKSFSEATKIGKAKADNRVEFSLYQRAVGYSHASEEIKVIGTGLGTSEIVRVPIIKHYPPDAASMIFWLKNRRPKEWRDKIDTTISNPDGSEINIKAQLVELAREIVAAQREQKQLEQKPEILIDSKLIDG